MFRRKLTRLPGVLSPIRRLSLIRLARLLPPLMLLISAAPASAEPTRPSRAKVTYVTSSTIYVDAGAEQGLHAGDVVKVYRGDVLITELEITAVASKRASCRRSDPATPIELGDEVRLPAAGGPGADKSGAPAGGSGAVEPAAPPPGAGGAHASGEGASFGRWLGEHGLRGRIGVRYLGLFDRSDYGEDYSQPALDLRITASSLGHEALHFTADVRAHRTYRSPGESDASAEGRTRVYRLSAEWSHGSDGFSAVAGRQPSNVLAAIGIFDGLSAEYGAGRWRFGALSGSQPDPVHFGFSREILEHGVYVDWRERASGASRWRLSSGLIGSYTGGAINRESLVLQGRYSGERLFASAIQDVDVNRGWKQDAGESTLQLTSSFLSVRWRLAPRVSLDGGLDTRRTVRLYRDRETPETEFDDTYRQGTWGGIDWEPLPNTRFGVSVRHTTGGSSGSANTATFSTSAGLPSFHGASLRFRSTYYENEMVEGWLHSGGAGASLGKRLHAEIGGGLRTDTSLVAIAGEKTVRWWSLDADYRITQGWAMLLSMERSRGDDEGTDQVYASAVYRF